MGIMDNKSDVLDAETNYRHVEDSAQVTIREVFDDFMQSRIAMNCQPRTIEEYRFTIGKHVIGWLEKEGYYYITQVDSSAIMSYIGSMKSRKQKGKGGVGLSDSTVNRHAREIRTFLKYATDREYIVKRVWFPMPRIAKKKLPYLNIEEVKTVMTACVTPRDAVVFLLAVDCGLRLKEITDLNWGDIDIENSVIEILAGKGDKFRRVPIGNQLLPRLYAFKISLGKVNKYATADGMPVFQKADLSRLSEIGLRSLFIRLSRKSGVVFSAHALRRTFARLAIKHGYDVYYLQQVMGHENLETTRKYIQGLDLEDVISHHKDHSPLDLVLDNRANRPSSYSPRMDK